MRGKGPLQWIALQYNTSVSKLAPQVPQTQMSCGSPKSMSLIVPIRHSGLNGGGILPTLGEVRPQIGPGVSLH